MTELRIVGDGSDYKVTPPPKRKPQKTRGQKLLEIVQGKPVGVKR